MREEGVEEESRRENEMQKGWERVLREEGKEREKECKKEGKECYWRQGRKRRGNWDVKMRKESVKGGREGEGVGMQEGGEEALREAGKERE